LDIVSGSFWYRQPADPWVSQWEQTRLGEALDAVAALDLDGGGRAEIVAQRGSGGMLQMVLLRSTDATASTFHEYVLGEVPAASHDLGSQGHVLANLVGDEQPEIAVSSGGGVFYFEVSEAQEAGTRSGTRICVEASDEGIALADIDGDGLLDLVATTGESKEVAWWLNPGDRSPDWARREVGSVGEMVFPDRAAAADLDADGRSDIVVTEENGGAGGAKAFWWRNPGELSSDWARHPITSRGSLNSLFLADMNADGRVDLIMGEHRGALRISMWHNLGGGRFVEQQIDEGRESHLGARAVDLDADGDLDLVSTGWDSAETIHVWRNDAVEELRLDGKHRLRR
jgi:hypothetical protein